MTVLPWVLLGGWILTRKPTATVSTGPFTAKRYKAGTPEQVALFTAAAKTAGLPEAWASDPDLQFILQKESLNGWVGIPNFKWAKWLGTTSTKMWADPDSWPKVWEVIRSGNARPSYTGITSHAVGLGQMQPSNMELYYPDGLQGCGDPLNEAVGMLRYVSARYGTPAKARAFWEKNKWY
jgi:hypothetical protein